LKRSSLLRDDSGFRNGHHAIPSPPPTAGKTENDQLGERQQAFAPERIDVYRLRCFDSVAESGAENEMICGGKARLTESLELRNEFLKIEQKRGSETEGQV